MTPRIDALATYNARYVAWIDAAEATVAADTARRELRQQITESLIGQPNPMTSKPHSATSAEAAAELTPDYRDAAATCALTTRAERLALMERECAKYALELGIAGVDP